MEHQETTQSTDLGSRPLAAPTSIIRQYFSPTQERAAGQAPGDSKGMGASLVQIADAVLNNELLGRALPGTELLPGDLLNIPENLEPTFRELREQANSLVDTIIKLLRDRPEQLAHMTSQFATLEKLFNGEVFQYLPLLRVPSPVSAGEPGRIQFSLFNDNPTDAVDYILHTTDLVGRSGHRIPATQIEVKPNSSTIPPGKSRDGQIEIQVPIHTPPGLYAGLLQDEDINRLQAAVQLLVGP